MHTADATLLGQLIGRRLLPWQTPRLRALAQALPAAAERSRISSCDEAGWSWEALREDLWPEILEHAVDQEPGWIDLAAACIAAVDLLAGREPTGRPGWPLGRPRRWGGQEENEEALGLGNDWGAVLDRVAPSLRGARDLKNIPAVESAFARLRRPQVHALLRAARPTRVLMSSGEAPAEGVEPEGADDVRAVARRILPEPSVVHWALDANAVGRSAMAAMFLRLVADTWPSQVAFLGDVGITGELDDAGCFLPVDDLIEKVRRFFTGYPRGTCFVPLTQVAELDELMPEHVDWREEMFARRHPRRKGRITTAQWVRVVPVASARHLLVLLGVACAEQDAALGFFDDLRGRSGQVADWRGRLRPVDTLAPLPIQPTAATGDEARYRRASIADLALVPWGRDSAHLRLRRLVLTGRPGSGKSMVLRQLHHALLRGEARLRGPSVLVPARRFLRGKTLAQAIAEEVGHGASDIAKITQTEDLAAVTWLLVDGLDELPMQDRRRVVGLVDAWPGPSVLSTRGLPEQLPDGARFEVCDLATYDATKVLEAEDRKDLAEALGAHRSYGFDLAADPEELLRSELGRTPLGLSLMALVWRGDGASRQDLLREAVFHLVRRAEANGRLTPGSRRRFERQGLRVLGASAWRMLCDGRATLYVEDLAAAEDELGLKLREGDVLHEVVEHGGFVQPVGPGCWEFTHKSLAELAAATYLASKPEAEAIDEVVSRIGDPAANEVLLHAATLLDSAEPVLAALLARTDRWLTALRLATRVLLEVPADHVAPESLVRVLAARLRIWSWMPDQPLPGDLDGITDVQRAIQQHREALGPHLDILLDACHPSVGRWARDPEGEASRIEERQRQRWEHGAAFVQDEDGEEGGDHRFVQLGQWFARVFEMHRGLRALLQADGGVEQLRRRGPGEWVDQLPPLFDNPRVGRPARDLWWELLPDSRVLDEIGALHPDHPYLGRVLDVVAKRGTPNQRRDALLRATLPAGDGSQQGEAIAGGLADLPADEVLSLWEPAWRVGVLGQASRWGSTSDAKSKALERLYGGLLDDALGPARWRAVVALRSLLSDATERRGWDRKPRPLKLPPGTTSRLRACVRDEDLAVRAEALSMLAEGGVRLPLSELVTDMLASGPDLRGIALRAILVGRDTLPAELVAHVMAVDEPEDEEEPGRWRETPPELPWRAGVRHRAEEAREVLLSRLHGELATWSGAEALFALANEPALRPLIERVVDAGSPSADGPSTTVILRALRSMLPLARRWGAGHLGWRCPDVPEDLLDELVRDPDAVVAERAQRELERRHPDRTPAPSWMAKGNGVERPAADEVAGAPASPAELDESALSMPLGLARQARGATISLEALKATTSFEEAWDLLGRGALATETAQDMDGYMSPDGVDFIMELAQEAADKNRTKVREAFEHLRRLYSPEWRDTLIDDLGHPSRGLFAKFLLALSPPDREILRAVHQGDAAARRVAELAAGTPLGLAVVDALVEAIADGDLVVGDGATEWGGYHEPDLSSTLRRLGGREAMLRLLVGSTSTELEKHALRALLNEHFPIEGQLSDGTAQEARRWVRARIGGGNRAELLGVLAICGTSEDAARWRGVLDTGGLGVDEQVAVVRLVGAQGSADDSGWLRALALDTPHQEVVEAVMSALEDLGGLENARWMMARLDDPPPCIASTRARWAAYERKRKALQAAAQAAGDGRWYSIKPMEPEPPNESGRWQEPVHRAIVRHGDDELGMALAWRLDRWAGAIDLCQEHGRLPSHALLVLGAVDSDPGEYVIPASVTGGGDEIGGSGVPERVREAVQAIVKRTDRESVRRALLEAMLRGYGENWGSCESTGLLEQIFFQLGGPQPADEPRLLRHLGEQPTDPTALRYLATMGTGEAELLDIWRRHGIDWLPPEQQGVRIHPAQASP